jgi:hypothetical protein
MPQDLLAELAGYNDELALESRRGRGERADAVRDEIARVRREIGEQADRLEAEADDHVEQGQDLKAAQAAVAARGLRAALEAAGPHPAPLENTAESRPKETARATTKPAAGKPAGGAKGGS